MSKKIEALWDNRVSAGSSVSLGASLSGMFSTRYFVFKIYPFVEAINFFILTSMPILWLKFFPNLLQSTLCLSIMKDFMVSLVDVPWAAFTAAMIMSGFVGRFFGFFD